MSRVASPLRRRGLRAPASPGRRGGRPTGDEAAIFDAFISYSHAVDGKLAPALQTGLHRFAKPWYRLRALRVFRDETSLSANPALWDSIVHALDRSRWLVLLASPDAARSKWVNQEIEHWCATKQAANVLVVVTSDDRPGDFDWERSNAVPPALRSELDSEPRAVDLRWAHAAQDVSLHNARFRDAVADVAATLHGRPKDELYGEDVRQHKRTRRLVRAVVAMLALLLAGAIVAAVIAFDQREQARAERDRAEAQARLATSRQLASQSQLDVDDRYDRSLLLGVEAVRVQPTFEARASLLAALGAHPGLEAFLHGHGSPLLALAATGDGRSIASVSQGGTALRWDTATHQPLPEPLSVGAASAAAFDQEGSILATGTSVSGLVTLRELPDGRELGPPLETGLSQVNSLALSLDGRVLAAGEADAMVIGLWDVRTGTALGVPVWGEFTGAMAFGPDGATFVTGDLGGGVAFWDAATGLPSGDSVQANDVGAVTALAVSENGRVLAAGGSGGQITVWRVRDRARVHSLFDLDAARGVVSSLAFSSDGRTLASGGSGGSISLWNAASGERRGAALSVSAASIETLAFVGSDRMLTAGDANGDVVLWDLASPPRLGRRLPGTALAEESAAFSSDGRLLALPTTRSTPSQVTIWDVRSGEKVQTLRFPEDGFVTNAAFAPSGDTIVVGDLDGGSTSGICRAVGSSARSGSRARRGPPAEPTWASAIRAASSPREAPTASWSSGTPRAARSWAEARKCQGTRSANPCSARTTRGSPWPPRTASPSGTSIGRPPLES